MMHLLIIEETLGAEVIKWVFGILLVMGILAVIAYPIVGMIYGNRKWLQQIYGENWKEKKKEYWKEYGRAKFITEWKKYLPWIAGYLLVLIIICICAVVSN